MSEKKGLSAFINKNKKTKKTMAGTAKATDSKDLQPDTKAAHDVEEQKKNTPVGGDSSDEEVDELEIANKNIDYGNIKENKDVSRDMDAEKKQGFGLEDELAQETEIKVKQSGKKFGESGSMSFGKGPPRFSNKRATKIGKQGDFDAGLDDLDGDGNDVKKTTSGASGQREFVSLSSSAKTGQDGFQREEVKERAAPVKPTFRGKANLTKTGAAPEEKSDGVVKSYDFGSVFKTENDGQRFAGNPEERKQRTEGTRGGRGRGGFNKGGRPFNEKEEKSDDDEFEVVKDGKRKPQTYEQRRQNRAVSSSDDEGQAKQNDGQRFGGFGGRGRGGEGFRGSRGGEGFRGGRGGRDEGDEREDFRGVRTEGEGLRNARVERGGTRGDRGADRGARIFTRD